MGGLFTKQPIVQKRKKLIRRKYRIKKSPRTLIIKISNLTLPRNSRSLMG